MTPQESLPAGIWRRLGAFAIDCVLIGLVGVLAGTVLYDTLVNLGGWGRLLGFVIGLAYFGPLNSRLGGGQTLGKRLLGIKVIGADGAPLPLPRSLLRYAVIGTPWFLNGAPYPPDLLMSPVIYVLSLAIFGLGLSTIYLFFFNRPTRRALHDLVAGSYVVRAEGAGRVAEVPLWRTHRVLVAVIFVAAAITPLITSRLATRGSFAGIMQTFRAVSAEPGITHAQVNKGWSSGSNGRVTYLQITAFLAEPRLDDAELARRLARTAIEADPSALKLQVLRVLLVYGYDIGIASAHRSRAYDSPPAVWAGAEPAR
ncbi:MAG TPA: RDD family protein [Steroidobacteraceae bacterium]